PEPAKPETRGYPTRNRTTAILRQYSPRPKSVVQAEKTTVACRQQEWRRRGSLVGTQPRSMKGKTRSGPAQVTSRTGRFGPSRREPARPPLDLLAHSGGGDGGWSMGIGADGTGWPG